MGFSETLAALSKRVPNLIEHLDTEEATKNALVMPFISALGYNVFDPTEVIPEFTADVGTKKGEKVDYAITHDGKVIILVECKTAGVDLRDANVSQLFRYFSVTNARIAILTNGVQYRFFSDLEAPNRMDSKPFLELDLLDPREDLVDEVKKLSKESFDLEMMLSAASELKYLRELSQVLNKQLDEPDEDFVRLLFGIVNPGSRFTKSVKVQWGPLVAKAFTFIVRERVNSRLRTALHQEAAEAREEQADLGETRRKDVVTTEEELEGFQIVRAIVSQVIAPDRVVYRDTKSYFGILVDDNNRKPICRLLLQGKTKYVGLFDSEKREQRQKIDSLLDLYQYSDQMKAAATQYD